MGSGEGDLEGLAGMFVADIAELGTWVWDRATDRARWNRAHERLLGYDVGAERHTYEEWASRLHPADRARVERELRETLEAGGSYDSRYRVVLPDGTIRVLHGRGGPVPGAPHLLAGALWDVTDDAAAQRRIADLAAMFEEAQRVASVGVVTIDLDTLEVWNSEEIARIAGHPPGTQLSLADAVAQLHPHDRAREEQRLAALLGGGSMTPGEFRIIRADGQVAHVRAAGSVLEGRDHPTGRHLVLALWDVTARVAIDTARRNTERALRTLSRGNAVVARATSAQSLLEEMCAAIVEAGTYPLACFAPVVERPAMATVTRCSRHACADFGSVVGATAGWLVAELREQAGATVVGLGAPTTPSSWRRAAATAGLRSCVVLPVREDARLIGVVVVAADDDDATAFAEDESVQLFADLADGISLGLTRLRQASELVAAEHRRVELLERLVSLGQDERRRLALELHDDPVQRAVAATLFLDAIAVDDLAAASVAHLASARRLVSELTTSLRNVLFELAPPELAERGLPIALRSALDHLFGDTAVEATSQLDVAVEPPSDVAAGVYRIALEALVNAKRHAGAGRVHLALECDRRELHLEVADDGRGFDATESFHGHLGLRSMQDRAAVLGGSLHVDTAPGAGCRVVLELSSP